MIPTEPERAQKKFIHIEITVRELPSFHIFLAAVSKSIYFL